MKENYCYIVDSSMTTYKIKQDKVQRLFSTKELKSEDVEEQLGNEDIIELLDTMLYAFGCFDKYNIQYLLDHYNDVMCDLESESEE
jgi:hypothetical protein